MGASNFTSDSAQGTQGTRRPKGLAFCVQQPGEVIYFGSRRPALGEDAQTMETGQKRMGLRFGRANTQ